MGLGVGGVRVVGARSCEVVFEGGLETGAGVFDQEARATLYTHEKVAGRHVATNIIQRERE